MAFRSFLYPYSVLFPNSYMHIAPYFDMYLMHANSGLTAACIFAVGHICFNADHLILEFFLMYICI